MNPQHLSWTIIGVSTLLLALSVVVLARLRWIQTRPMKACVVLSVFAHLLLVAVFYFSRIFDVPFIPGGDPTMIVHLMFDDEQFVPQRLDRDPQALQPPMSDDSPLASLTPVPETAEAKPPPEPPQSLQPQPAASELTLEAHVDEPPAESSQPEIDPPPALDEQAEPATAEPDTTAPPPHRPEDAPPLAPPPLDAALPDATAPIVAPLETPPAPLLETVPAVDVPDDVPHDVTVGNTPTAETHATNRRDDLLEAPPGRLPERDVWQSAVRAHPVPPRYRDRIERPSAQELARRGGNPRTEAAVEAALNWLAGAQQPDGSWNAAQHGGGRSGWVEGQNRGTTGLKADTGITGLALLSFLGAGHSPHRGLYRDNVNQAIEYLIAKQDRLGSLSGDASIYARMYCHGIATLSLCEALVISNDETVRAAAQRAIDYTIGSQHRQTGGWRYSPGDRGDTSQFGWQLMALVSAREAELDVPAQIDERLHRFLRSVQKGNYNGLASYRPGHAPSRSMTAEALACRLFLSSRSQLRDREAAQYISSMRPGQGRRNFYYWYYATVALSQLDDEHWPAWNRALQKQLLPTQRRHGRMAGSWDPNTVWGGCGGRVYSTALATLCLESYYRYAPADHPPRGDHDRPSPPVANGWSSRRDRR